MDIVALPEGEVFVSTHVPVKEFGSDFGFGLGFGSGG